MAQLIVLGGLDEAVIAAVSDRSGIDALTAESDDLTTVIDSEQTPVIVAPASSGIALAQEVHRIQVDAAVIYIADSAEACTDLLAALAITPSIGRHARCVVAGDASVVELLVDELDHARKRTEHRLAVQRVRGTLNGVVAVTPDDASRFLGQLFTHVPIGILITDHSSTIKAANPGIEEVLGWLPHHTIGSHLSAMFSGDDATRAREIVHECATVGSTLTETLVRTGPDGATQHLEVRIAPIDPEHSNLGVIILLRDETERIQAVEAAEHARASAEASADRYATVARILQESLLPPDLPQIDGVEVAALFHPAGDGSEIGGDFYDFFQITEEEWFVAIGDVCGKGASAARLTALSRYTLRAAASRSPDLQRNLSELNEALLMQANDDQRRLSEHRFVTVAAFRLRLVVDGLFIRAGVAGHPRPITVRAGGEVKEEICRGRLLGMFEEVELEVCDVHLEPGDVLVAYTDGVTEARRGDELFGEKRLLALLTDLAGSSPRQIVDTIEKAVLDFQVGTARDDIAVIAIGMPPHS